jgi:hypothetical protein
MRATNESSEHYSELLQGEYDCIVPSLSAKTLAVNEMSTFFLFLPEIRKINI